MKTLSPFSLIGISVLSIVLLVPLPTEAGTMNGQISGTVTDPTGAVIPGAKLTLVSVATGAVSTAVSGSQGLYSFPNISPGIYNLTVSAPGFKSYVQNGIEVAMAGVYRIDVKLEVGSAVQKVEVSANASPLNNDTPRQGAKKPPKSLKYLPPLFGGTPLSGFAFPILKPGS